MRKNWPEEGFLLDVGAYRGAKGNFSVLLSVDLTHKDIEKQALGSLKNKPGVVELKRIISVDSVELMTGPVAFL